MANIYKERPLTVKLSESAYDKFKTRKFTMLTTETGTGKTYVAIRTAWLINPKTVLLILDPKSKILEAGWQDSLDSFNEAKNSDLQIHEFNYEKLINEKGITAINNVLNDAKTNNRPVLLIFDELHYLKLSVSGTMSKRTRAAIKLHQSGLVTKTIGITATPMPNSYLDGGTYFILGGYYPNKSAFLQDQIVMFNDYHAPVVKDANNNVSRKFFKDPDKLDLWLKDMTINSTNQSSLPPIKKVRLDFDLDNKTPYIFDDYVELSDDSEPKTHRKYYNILRKMRSYFEYPTVFTATMRKIITTDNNRINKLGWILYKIFYNDPDPAPVLIFYQYNLEMNTIVEFLQTNAYFKDKIELKFVNAKHKDVQTPKNPYTVILIQYRAGSAAIEYPTSKTSIFFMPTYSYQDFKQAKGRNVRDGGKFTVTHYELSARGTLDDLVWSTLDSKKSFSNKLKTKFFNIEN